MMEKKSSRGFSLLELMIGLGVGAIVSLSGAYVAVQSTKVNQMSSLQTELNQEHIVALQRLKDTDNILARIGENEDDVNECFAKRSDGTNCATLNMPDLEGVAFDFATCVGTTCNFEHELEYRLECANSTTCSKLELKLTTKLKDEVAEQKQYFAKNRVSHIFVSGLVLSSRAQIDFSCAAGNRIISAISFNTLRTICDAYVTQQTCAAPGSPLQQFGTVATCQAMAQESCPTYGFASLGIFQTHSTCNLGGTGTTFTPPNSCPATALNWSVGGVSCTGNVAVTTEGNPASASDTTGFQTGSASFICNTDGTWSAAQPGATCTDSTPPTDLPCTADASLKWGAFVVNLPGHPSHGTTEYLCTNDLPSQTVPSGQNFAASMGTEYSPGFKGTGIFNCSNGTWTYMNGSCSMTAPHCCAGQSGGSVNCFGVTVSCPVIEPVFNLNVDPCSEGGWGQNAQCCTTCAYNGQSSCKVNLGMCDAGSGMCAPCDECPSGQPGTALGYCPP